MTKSKSSGETKKEKVKRRVYLLTRSEKKEDLKLRMLRKAIVANREDYQGHEYRPRRLSKSREREKHALLTFEACVIPEMKETRSDDDVEHMKHEFVVDEGRAMDLKMVPLIIDHQLIANFDDPTSLERVGTCLGSWTEGNDKWVLCALYDDPDSPTVRLAKAFLEKGLTTAVSLHHVTIRSPKLGVIRWPIEVSICTVPRRDGATIRNIKYL